MVSDEATYGGPYLTTAVFCENAIEDKHGVLSLIRIIDRTTVTLAGPDAPEKMPQIALTASLVLTFKAGFAKGSHTVRVRPRTPNICFRTCRRHTYVPLVVLSGDGQQVATGNRRTDAHAISRCCHAQATCAFRGRG